MDDPQRYHEKYVCSGYLQVPVCLGKTSLPSMSPSCVYGAMDGAGRVRLFFSPSAVFIHPRKYFKYFVSIMLF